MKLLLLSSLAVLGAGMLPQGDLPAPIKGHVGILQEAKSFKAEFTVTKLSGGVEKGSLVYSKSGMFKIDMGNSLIESDGKLVWTFNKQANTYTEVPATLSATKDPAVWAWAAFFNADALKGTKEYTLKGSRTLRGNAVSEYTAKMANDKPFSLFMDAKTGIARGMSNSESIILAQGDMMIGKQAMDIKDFTFTPPAGAKKEEKPAADSVTYAKVEALLKANCLPCHSAGNMKAGLSVETYEGVMRKVVAGNAAGSGLFRSISGPRPSMPQGRSPMAKADVDVIEAWINAGAKKE